MKLARVVGNVVSTIKDESYQGYKLMIVEYLDERGEPDGARQIVFDSGHAGVGDLVLVVLDGGAANMTLEDEAVIADAVIVGVLDSYTYGKHTEYCFDSKII